MTEIGHVNFSENFIENYKKVRRCFVVPTLRSDIVDSQSTHLAVKKYRMTKRSGCSNTSLIYQARTTSNK